MLAGFPDGGGGGPPAVLGEAVRGHREEVLLRGRLPLQVRRTPPPMTPNMVGWIPICNE